MDLGAELTLSNVVRALEEKETGFIRIVADCGDGEVELRLSPETLARLKGLCSQRKAQAGGEEKRFEVCVTPYEASVQTRLTESGLVFTLNDPSGKETFHIVIQDLGLALKLKEGLDSFVNFRTSLVALKGENLFLVFTSALTNFGHNPSLKGKGAGTIP